MDDLLDLACLTYDEGDSPDRWARASALLRDDPALPERSPWVAAAVGDPDLIREHLDREPGLATAEGGPRQWSPLLYLAYSRLPQRDPVATATLLLDAGADPNDAQTLYNRMFGRDDSHLRLLLDHGLGGGDGGVWHARIGAALESPDEMVRRQVDWATEHGLTDRLRLLAEHGFTAGTAGRTPWSRRRPPHPHDRIGTPGAVLAAAAEGIDLDALVDGRTLLHQAAFLDDAEMVRALLAAGARTDIVDREHGTTPLQWATWAYAHHAAALLRGTPPGQRPS